RTIRFSRSAAESGTVPKRETPRSPCSNRRTMGQGRRAQRGALRRVLRLPPPLVSILHRHRASLDRMQLKSVRAGTTTTWYSLARWARHARPRNCGSAGSGCCSAWGCPIINFILHELRHTAASLAMAEGASLFHASRMLGHSSISITADVYGHMTDEGREDVATRMGRALFGSIENSSA